MGIRQLTAAWTATALLATAAAGHAANATNVTGKPEFVRLDTNRDGRISITEARKLPDFERAFREADDNRDGKLDPDEFLKAQAVYDRMRATQYLEDSLITVKVKAALLRDLQLKGLEVKVETDRGAVLLSGQVNDPAQARRAAEIAAGVEGVSAVRNGLLVKG